MPRELASTKVNTTNQTGHPRADEQEPFPQSNGGSRPTQSSFLGLEKASGSQFLSYSCLGKRHTCLLLPVPLTDGTLSLQKPHLASPIRATLFTDHSKTYQYNYLGLGLSRIYQPHDGLYSTSYFLCCVFMVICSNPNNSDLQRRVKG